MEVQLLISFNEERLVYLDDAGTEQQHAQLRARSHLPRPHTYALHAPPTSHPNDHDPHPQFTLVQFPLLTPFFLLSSRFWHDTLP
jgi:hypothetical protein